MKKILFTPLTKLAKISGHFPIPAIKTIPEWFTKMSFGYNGSNKYQVRNGGVTTTVKGCMPFYDAMTAGYMVTLEEDIMVDWVDNCPRLNWRTTREAITFHSVEQAGGMKAPKGFYEQVIKFENQVRINTPKGFSIYFTHPSNRWDLPFLTISGFVETDNYGMAVKFPFFIRENWTGVIEAGTPIAQIIPVKREEWESEIKKYDEEDVLKTENQFFKYIHRTYKRQHWIRKSYK
jgi:hypothetical protein